MINMAGWKQVEAYIRGRITHEKEQLMHCDLDKVVEHRARAEALQAVFLYINETIEEGSE